MRRRFLASLAELLPADDLAVEGGRDVFRALAAAGHRAAIATGGWRAEAELKLARAGIPFAGVPMATSDDSPDRAEILRLAAERAGPGPALYVGDGPWDRSAAADLGLPFVGVDESGSGALLGPGCAVLLDLRSLLAFISRG
jgi:phosphoglycolate phosphatase-like HAD superfamily hydrolase